MQVFITGFMGVGKTTIGKQVSLLLGYGFRDLDTYIEEKEGKSISAIFSDEGETHFRNLEDRYLKEVISLEDNQIVALGGGTLQNASITTCILRKGILVYLYKPWEEIAESLKKLTCRPILKQKSEDELRFLFESRESIYEHSQLKMPINTAFTAQKLAQMLRLSTNR